MQEPPPPKRKKTSRVNTFGAQSHENETPGWIVTNFRTDVGVHDVITSANFYDCRLWGLSVVGGQILGFSIDSRRRPYNTLALPCECVIRTAKTPDVTYSQNLHTPCSTRWIIRDRATIFTHSELD